MFELLLPLPLDPTIKDFLMLVLGIVVVVFGL